MAWIRYGLAVLVYTVYGVSCLEQKDMAMATAEGIPVHEVPSVILLAPEQLSVLKVLGDRLKIHHIDTDQFLSHDSPHEQDNEVLDVDLSSALKNNKALSKVFNTNTDPEGRFNAGTWEHLMPSPLKRRAGGKLCYINPIACFGRRQREAAN